MNGPPIRRPPPELPRGVLLRLELPLPPSANAYWRHRNNPNPRLPPIVHVSPEGQEYQKRVARIVLPQRHPRLQGLVSVTIAMWMERETGDADNRIKPLLDALENAELFQPKPPKKEKGDNRPQAPWGDRQVAHVEAYQAGVSPLEEVPEEERERQRVKAGKAWRRKDKAARKRGDDPPPAPGEPRKNRRYGVVLVEIAEYTWPGETIEAFKRAAGWEDRDGL